MTDSWIILGVMLTLVVVGTVVSIVYNLRYTAQVVEQFEKLGNVFDLELTIPKRSMLGLYQRNPSLYGNYADREMSIYPRGYGMDNTRQTDTAVRMEVRVPKSLNMSLARKSLAGKLGQLARLKLISTGDAKFDNNFTLRSNNPGVTAIFDEDLRKQLLKTWQSSSGFLSLHEGTLTYEEMGLPRTEAQRQHVEMMTRLCLEIAKTLDGWTQ